MIFHDFNLRGGKFSSDLELVREAYRLGWNHVNLMYSTDNYLNLDYKDELIEESLNLTSEYSKGPISIDFGVEINVKNPNDIRKYVKKFRDSTNIISIWGGDIKINRIACENIQIDVLSRPYFKRYDAGLNHVLAKEAVRNNVAIELCLNDVLNSYLTYRAKIIANFRDIIKLYKKFKFPLILSSGAKSIFDIRTPQDTFTFFKLLGLDTNHLQNCFNNNPRNIINFNKERDNIVVQGVKKIRK
ncbi:ribonuclease P protein component 3 [Methanobrevibacter filiformis]|uniref:Ribonuclease P protein component 3 n=1 Tax=Methanobrevibacter filiformis TaxID=55758 RepID=A0A166CAH0_9EURY|nr:RNase P subunit p30 family protein [Methanobrevibacter filiformis]KZX12687.1 ribonuclease P protein component 3 [Methanobrevibacter filiformis]